MAHFSSTYPRPDFQRTALNWASLDGQWDFIFDDGDDGLNQEWQKNGLPAAAPHSHSTNNKRKITVPYAFQTPASGIGIHEAHEVIWYERTIKDIRTLSEEERGNRLLVRFGAVDYECSVWINGYLVGQHRGGHVPFDVDVTAGLKYWGPSKEARLTVRVRDSPYDLTQPRGKQYWKPVSEKIWYTPTSGIWLPVWMESVPRTRLGSGSEGTILRSDNIEGGKLHAQVAVVNRIARAKHTVEIEASLDDVRLSGACKGETTESKDIVTIDVDMKVPPNAAAKLRSNKAPFNVEGSWLGDVALWHPDHPILYDLTLRLYDEKGALVDEVQTTTGMRKLDWQTGDGTFRINNKPIFQALVLDQGFWPETGMTPPSEESLKLDIEMSQKMGFNGCRKHQKIEDPRFMYWADRLGYLVWGEIANAYEFDDEYVERFNGEWLEMVKRDINYPCIVTWTPNNESWGYTSLKHDIDNLKRVTSLKNNVELRNHMRTVYFLTKTLDPSRPINDNCGWEHVQTDLTTFHDYNDAAVLAENCSKLEGGILADKTGGQAEHPMFCEPIYHSEGSSQKRLLDPGCKHLDGAPVICTEFGGVNIAAAATASSSKGAGGGSSSERDWGYTTASDAKDLLYRFEKLLMAVVEGGHTCGYVYTQLYDIKQEVNGLYSYDRRAKIPAADVKEVVDRSLQHYYAKVAPK